MQGGGFQGGDEVQVAWESGVVFGLASGVVTTLGLMVGLHAGTGSTLAVVGGILTIAVADALSDAMGIHLSEEAKRDSTGRQVWLATAATLLTKLGVALTFLVPVLLFELSTAIVISVAWGLGLLAALSCFLARSRGVPVLPVVAEHLAIALAVVVATHFLGDWLAGAFPEP